LRELALFAGAGGGILGGILLGWTTVCAVELDDYCQRVLKPRQGSRRVEKRWWQSEPNVGRVADGVASRVDRLRAIGNGQVPIVAATAFLELRRRLEL